MMTQLRQVQQIQQHSLDKQIEQCPLFRLLRSNDKKKKSRLFHQHEMLQFQVSVTDKKRSLENKKAVINECLAQCKESEMYLSLRHTSFFPPRLDEGRISCRQSTSLVQRESTAILFPAKLKICCSKKCIFGMWSQPKVY